MRLKSGRSCTCQATTLRGRVLARTASDIFFSQECSTLDSTLRDRSHHGLRAERVDVAALLAGPRGENGAVRGARGIFPLSRLLARLPDFAGMSRSACRARFLRLRHISNCNEIVDTLSWLSGFKGDDDSITLSEVRSRASVYKECCVLASVSDAVVSWNLWRCSRHPECADRVDSRNGSSRPLSVIVPLSVCCDVVHSAAATQCATAPPAATALTSEVWPEVRAQPQCC